MGDIKKPRKQYSVPRKRWDKERIEKEKKILEAYGLKNKRELRRFETFLRDKRKNARNLLALTQAKRARSEKELFENIARIGLLPRTASIDDVLSLQVEEILEKRLATIVWRKNLAKTIKQARQFIAHGHIAIGGKKITAPNYIVKASEVNRIGYYKRPMQLEPFKEDSREQMKREFEQAKGEKLGEEIIEKTGEENDEPVAGKTGKETPEIHSGKSAAEGDAK
ncbi:MAG: 30S ribosomal protein S4 [Candidatus Diapherotrites archaeon]|nr:30S ribosomal protein S4 [Candidatus Diapherotrites archaeon]